jgi:hypothetical protein
LQHNLLHLNEISVLEVLFTLEKLITMSKLVALILYF